MTALLPIALQTVLVVAAVLGALAVVAYILKMRRRRFEVPFSTLWHRVLREKEATSLWKHLRRFLSLMLQLLMIALLILAVLDIQLGSSDDDARSVVLIIDASASMKVIDEGPEGKWSRMDVARAKAHDLLSSMGGGDAAMIMRMDGQTTPLSRFDSDMPMLHKVVDGMSASHTPADLRRALSAAADALRGRQNPMIVIVGDGAYPSEVLDDVTWTASGSAAPESAAPGDVAPESAAPGDAAPGDVAPGDVAPKNLAAIDLSGVEVRFIPVGQEAENVGIVAFNARRYLADKTSYTVFIEVQNFGEEAAARKLVVYSGTSAVDVKTITLQPGERLREIYPKLSGGQDNRLRAELQPLERSSGDRAGDRVSAPSELRDAFALDDTAHALLPARKKQKVLLVTEDNLYLEGAMLVYDSIQVDKLTPAAYDEAVGKRTLPDYNAVVFDSHTPAVVPDSPQVHLMYFNPQGENSPFPVRQMIPTPRVTETAEAHPVMRWVIMNDVNFDQSAAFGLDRSKGDVPLARYVRDTIIAARKDGQRKILAFGFSLGGTDLTLRVAFPLLLVNALDWFAGDDADLITTYRTGQRFRVPMDGTYGVKEVEVDTPSGKMTRAPLVDGRATFYGNWIGVHRLVARDQGQVVAMVELAANLANPDESRIAPDRELTMGGQILAEPEEFAITRQQSLWVYLVLFFALLLAIEWFTYHRRITV